MPTQPRKPSKKKKKLVRPSRAAALMPYGELTEMTERTLERAIGEVRDRGADKQTEAMIELITAAADCLDQAEEMLRTATRVRVALIRAQLAIGMTMGDVGAVHGLTRQRVGQLLKQYPPVSP